MDRYLIIVRDFGDPSGDNFGAKHHLCLNLPLIQKRSCLRQSVCWYLVSVDVICWATQISPGHLM